MKGGRILIFFLFVGKGGVVGLYNVVTGYQHFEGPCWFHFQSWILSLPPWNHQISHR